MDLPARTLAALLFALAACGEDPAPAPAEVPPQPAERTLAEVTAEVEAEALEALGDARDDAPTAPPGVVAGEVRSESGRPRVCEQVVLVRRDVRDGSLRTARVDWGNDDRDEVGRFRFEGVPDGVYELSGAATVEGFAWEREALEVTAPAEGLVLRLLDAGEQAWIEVTGMGRDSNRPVAGLRLVLASDLPGAAPQVFEGVETVSAGLQRADPGLRWRLVGRGHLPTQGTLADLEPAGERDGHPVLRARVDMLPGWTVRLLVRHGWRAPLPGAYVSIDDVPVGRTDPEGLLDLRRDATPKVLRVDAKGFRAEVLFGVDGMLGDPTDLDAPPLLDLELKRP